MGKVESDFLTALRAEVSKDEEPKPKKVFQYVPHHSKGKQWVLKLKCPKCRSTSVKVYDSRQYEHGRQRKRICADCKKRWATIEIPVELFESLTEET